MTLIAKDLIDDAVLMAHPFIAEHAISPGPLLRQLSALDGEVVDWFATTAPERLSLAGATLVVSTTLNPLGYQLSNGRSYHNFRYVTKDGIVFEEPINICTEREFSAPSRHPAGIVRGASGNNFFFPADPLAKDWQESDTRSVFTGDGDKIIYRFVPEAIRVTSLTQALVSPDEARDYFTQSLELQILLGSGLAPDIRLQKAFAGLTQTKQLLIHMASHRTPVQARFGE